MAEVVIDAKGKDLKEVNVKIKEAVANGQAVSIKNAKDCYGLASGLRGGKVKVHGDVSDYIGTVNTGAEIDIDGDANNFLGDNMISGTIRVSGNVAYGAGMYCYGGTMIIKGNAGDFSSTMNKGATIVIGGNVGNEVGTYMTAGRLLILGNAGDNLGNYIIRGTIYLGGKAKSYGKNVKKVDMTKEEIKEFEALFKAEGIDFDPSKLQKMVPESDKPFYHAPKGLNWEEEGCLCR